MKVKHFSLPITAMVCVGLLGSCAKLTTGVRHLPEDKEVRSIPHPRVHFPFDNDEVFTKELTMIDDNAQWLKKNGDAVVILEGHCDERGPSNYNMELGDRRARTIKAHLIDRGVPHEKIIMVVSFGETQPVDPRHNSDAWQMNRRVEFILR